MNITAEKCTLCIRYVQNSTPLLLSAATKEWQHDQNFELHAGTRQNQTLNAARRWGAAHESTKSTAEPLLLVLKIVGRSVAAEISAASDLQQDIANY